MPEYQNLRIIVRLQTPVATDGHLSLEAHLWREQLRLAFGFEIAAQPNVLPANCIELPFAKTTIRVAGVDFEINKCSLGRSVGAIAENRTFWTKRFPLAHQEIIDRRGKRGRILTAGGHYKAKNMPVFTKFANEICWYAVGDRSALEKLLRFVTNLGKYTVQGFGAVLDWRVEEWHSDWSLHSPAGVMRSIPSMQGTHFAFRPPSWSAANQTVCTMPSGFSDNSFFIPDDFDFYAALDEL